MASIKLLSKNAIVIHMPLQKYGLHSKILGKSQDAKNKPMLKRGEKSGNLDRRQIDIIHIR